MVEYILLSGRDIPFAQTYPDIRSARTWAVRYLIAKTRTNNPSVDVCKLEDGGRKTTPVGRVTWHCQNQNIQHDVYNQVFLIDSFDGKMRVLDLRSYKPGEYWYSFDWTKKHEYGYFDILPKLIAQYRK